MSYNNPDVLSYDHVGIQVQVTAPSPVHLFSLLSHPFDYTVWTRRVNKPNGSW